MYSSNRGNGTHNPRLVHVLNTPFALTFIRGQANYLEQAGFDVHVVTCPGEGIDEFVERENVPVHQIEMSRRISPLRDLVSLIQFWRLFRTLHPTIVHAGTPKGGLFGMLAAWLLRVPVRLYHVHGLRYETASGWKRFLLRWTEKLSCCLANHVFCVSPSVQRILIHDHICSSHKIAVLVHGSSNGVDSSDRFNPDRLAPGTRDAIRTRYSIPADSFLIGYVGRIVRDKGLVELVEAWHLLSSLSPPPHLLLVGPFEAQDPLPADVEVTLRSDPRIHLVNYTSNVAPFYTAMDLLVLPSHREGFGIVLLEAAAMRLPVVATRIAGCVDAVRDGVTGTLVPPSDSQSLALAIQRYLKDPELRRQHGQAGRDWVVRDFRPEELWKAFYQCYVRFLRDKGIEMVGCSSTYYPTRPSVRGTVARLIKRVLDIVAALAGLILLAPVAALAILGILITVGRPVYFRQLRVGFLGKLFILYKFRTMREGFGPDGHPLPDETRLTWFGRILRRTSIDELPQLWNVLKGDMSLVGPRPQLLVFLPYYTPEQSRRHSVRPGITGWAQVHGRNTLGFQDICRHDVWYVDHWSLWLDFKILARTVLKVFEEEGIIGKGMSSILRDEPQTSSPVQSSMAETRSGRSTANPNNGIT